MSTRDRAADVASHVLDAAAQLCRVLAGVAVGVAIVVTLFGGDAMWAVWTAAGLLGGYVLASLLSRIVDSGEGRPGD